MPMAERLIAPMLLDAMQKAGGEHVAVASRRRLVTRERYLLQGLWSNRRFFMALSVTEMRSDGKRTSSAAHDCAGSPQLA